MASPLSFKGECFFIPLRLGYVTSIVFSNNFNKTYEITLIGPSNVKFSLRKYACESDLAIIATTIRTLHEKANLDAEIAKEISNGFFVQYRAKVPKPAPVNQAQRTLLGLVTAQLAILIERISAVYAENEKAWPRPSLESTPPTRAPINYSNPQFNHFGTK